MPIRDRLAGFSIGCDICYKPRIVSIIRQGPKRAAPLPLGHQTGNLERFVKRLLSPHELEGFWNYWESPETCLDEARFDSFVYNVAGRWAAKEAMIKACRFRRLGLHDIMTLKRSTGAPYGVVLDEDVLQTVREPLADSSKVGLHRHSHHDTGIASSVSNSIPPVRSKALDGAVRKVLGSKDSDGLKEQHETGSDLSTRAGQASGFTVELSISHDGDYAVATCIMPREAQ